MPFATLVGKAVKGSDAVQVLTGAAPSLTVAIDDHVPMSLARALSGDMLISTFGRGPVRVEITGLDVYDANCSEGVSGSSAKERIQDFWTANNVNDNPSARLTLCLGSEKSSLYTCVLVGLSTSSANAATAQIGYNGLGMYKLSLVGCPANG